MVVTLYFTTCTIILSYWQLSIMLSLVALKDRKGVNERNKINTKSPDGAVSDEGGSAFSSNCRNNRHGSFSSLEVIVTIVHFFLHGNGESESVPKLTHSLSPLSISLTLSNHSLSHSLSHSLTQVIIIASSSTRNSQQQHTLYLLLIQQYY